MISYMLISASENEILYLTHKDEANSKCLFIRCHTSENWYKDKQKIGHTKCSTKRACTGINENAI